MYYSMFNMFNMIIIISSSMITMFMNNLFIMWILLEISSISYSIMLNYNQAKKASLIYFLISNLTSIMIIMSLIMFNYNNSSNLLLMFSLWMKLGMFPLNYWINLIINNMKYMMLIPLMIFMKIIPLMIFYSYMNLNQFIFLILMMTMIIPTLLAFNTFSFPLLINYSSMYHMSIMMMMIFINLYSTFMYFMFYSISTLLLINFLNDKKIYSKTSLNYNINYSNKMIYNIMMFFYAQLPPFSTFITKWFMIENMNNNYMIMFMLSMMISAIIMTFNYLNFSNITFFNFSIKYNYKMNLKMSYMKTYNFFILMMLILMLSYLFNYMYI